MADYSTPAGDQAAPAPPAQTGLIGLWISGTRYALSLAALAAGAITGNFAIGGLFIGGAANALTAHAGGGQTNGIPLTASINRVTTVASAGDSGLLPSALAGAEITVINDAASNSMNVFPASSETINALSANAAFAVAAGKTATFFSAVNGKWHSILTA